jgi:hypothetical protein
VPTIAAPPTDKAEAQIVTDPEAVAFVHELLAQRPTKEISLDGVFRVRGSDGQRMAIPVRYAVRLNDTNWQSVYQTARTSRSGPEELVVVHEIERPNRYQFTQINLDGKKTNTMDLAGPEATISFAGTDFWLADLGMEFLHWPEQRLVRNAKITMRFGRPCKVVESINPKPEQSSYSRVVSWIDADLGSVIRAEAYDLQGKRLKFFSLKSFKKINGHWQVQDMEIQNDHTDTRTVLEFHFEGQ